MAVHLINEAAVIRNGESVLLMLAPSAETVTELREALAKVNSVGLGDTSRELRHLLSDLEMALSAAFRPKPSLRTWSPGNDVG